VRTEKSFFSTCGGVLHFYPEETKHTKVIRKEERKNGAVLEKITEKLQFPNCTLVQRKT